MLLQVDDSAGDSPARRRNSSARSSAALEAGIVQDATIAQSGEQARALWALRENIAEAQRREGPNIKHDISLPVSAIAALPRRGRAPRWRRRCPGVRFVTFGHLGDGNLHYNLAAPEGVDAGDVHRATRSAPTASSTISSRRTAAASAPSTASAS